MRASAHLAIATLCAVSLLAGCKGHHASRADRAGPPADAAPKHPYFTKAMREICNSLAHADAVYTASPLERLGQASRWMKNHIRLVAALDLLNSLRGLPPDERATALREKARAAGLKHCALADYLDRVMMAKPDLADGITLVAKLRSIVAAPPKDRTSELVAACSKIPSCARSCVFAMAAVSAGPRDQWPKRMANCEDFAEFADSAGKEPWMAKLGTWIRKRIAGVAAQVAPKLDAEQTADLRNFCRRLHIPLKT